MNLNKTMFVIIASLLFGACKTIRNDGVFLIPVRSNKSLNTSLEVGGLFSWQVTNDDGAGYINHGVSNFGYGEVFISEGIDIGSSLNTNWAYKVCDMGVYENVRWYYPPDYEQSIFNVTVIPYQKVIYQIPDYDLPDGYINLYIFIKSNSLVDLEMLKMHLGTLNKFKNKYNVPYVISP